MSKTKTKPRLKEFWVEPKPIGMEKTGTQWGPYVLHADGWWRLKPKTK